MARIIKWRFVGRFQTSDSSLGTATPTLILPPNENRIGFHYQNLGTANVAVSHDQAELQRRGVAGGGGWRLEGSTASNPLTSPYAPMNPVWALGVAGADIDVAEAVWEDAP